MTETELRRLPLNALYEFTLYYGEKLIGFPEEKEDGWHIVNKTAHAEIKKRIQPAQVHSYKLISGSEIILKQQPNPISFKGVPRFKTLVILGAGASYNYSFTESPGKLPLAKDLFNYPDIITGFPGVESLSSQILLAKDIETYFQNQWEKTINFYNPILHNKLIDVHFYLHFLFQKLSSNPDYRTSNYMGVFQALRDHLIEMGDEEKALLVSFNYDTILEQSLTRAFNYRYDSLDDYIDIEQKKFALFKPHGSWNWIRQFNTEFINGLQLKNPGVAFSMSKLIYERKMPLGTFLSGLSNEVSILDKTSFSYYYPHLLIPYKTKDSFLLPESHLLLLDHFLDQIEKIIIIGWKGAEEKFKNLLKQKLGNKKIIVTCITAKDPTIEKELKEILTMANITGFSPYSTSDGTFTELNRFIQEYPDRIF